jgi:hypothetical protein
VSDSAALHSKWLLLPNIEISLVVNFCFLTNQMNSNFNCSYMVMSSLTYILGFSVKSFSASLFRLGILWDKNHIKIFCSEIRAKMIFGWPTLKIMCNTSIDTLQHQSLNLISSTLDHSFTSALLKWSFNSRSVTLSRKENLEIDIRVAMMW